jgi:hypothetical protein
MRQTEREVVLVHTMQAYGGWEGWFHPLFTLELDGDSGQIDVPVALSPAKEPSMLTEQGVGWVREPCGPFGDDKVCCFCQESKV